jgi:CheY-like chemotaxis protein
MNTTALRPMPTVLLVDDDEFLRDLMREMLIQLGVTVVHQAGNGREALAVLGELAQPPEFLICDIYMPDMDGIEFVAELARLHYAGGLILLSGVNPETLQLARDIALGEGIQLVGAFVKPVQPEALAQALGMG